MLLEASGLDFRSILIGLGRILGGFWLDFGRKFRAFGLLWLLWLLVLSVPLLLRFVETKKNGVYVVLSSISGQECSELQGDGHVKLW